MSDQPTQNQPQRRVGRGVKIALGLSLALNLIVVGLVVGIALSVRDWRGDDRRPPLRAMGLGPIAMVLDREDRQALRHRLETATPEIRGGGRGLAEGIRELTAALQSEPFDRSAAEAALERQRSNAQQLQASGHGVLLDQLEAMSAADRYALAVRIEERLRRHLRHGNEDR